MFEIGDKIICVDASMQAHTVEELLKDVPNWIKEGQEYTVRGFADHDFITGVYLEEVHNPPKWFKVVNLFCEPAFRIERFRKAVTQRQEAVIEFKETVAL